MGNSAMSTKAKLTMECAKHNFSINRRERATDFEKEILESIRMLLSFLCILSRYLPFCFAVLFLLSSLALLMHWIIIHSSWPFVDLLKARHKLRQRRAIKSYQWEKIQQNRLLNMSLTLHRAAIHFYFWYFCIHSTQTNAETLSLRCINHKAKKESFKRKYLLRSVLRDSLSLSLYFLGRREGNRNRSLPL